jgi:hypothetical protein
MSKRGCPRHKEHKTKTPYRHHHPEKYPIGEYEKGRLRGIYNHLAKTGGQLFEFMPEIHFRPVWRHS